MPMCSNLFLPRYDLSFIKTEWKECLCSYNALVACVQFFFLWIGIAIIIIQIYKNQINEKRVLFICHCVQNFLPGYDLSFLTAAIFQIYKNWTNELCLHSVVMMPKCSNIFLWIVIFDSNNFSDLESLVMILYQYLFEHTQQKLSKLLIFYILFFCYSV